MELDAAWHEWVSKASDVVIDGMLAVSAQCGYCHHFNIFLDSYAMLFVLVHLNGVNGVVL